MAAEGALLVQLRSAARARPGGGTDTTIAVAVTRSLTICDAIVFDGVPVVLHGGGGTTGVDLPLPEITFEGAGAFVVHGAGSLTLRGLCLRTTPVFSCSGGGRRNKRGNRRTVTVTGTGASLCLESCRIICESGSSGESPYPKTLYAAGVLAARGSTLTMSDCDVTSPGFQARGVVVKSGARATLTNMRLTECKSSAVWVTGRASTVAMKSCAVAKCGGYGAIYCTFGGSVSVCDSSVTFGKYGIMCLHEGSTMTCADSEFAFCLWSGVASRWSGSGTVSQCWVHGNGANGFQIRKSCAGPGGVVVTDCVDEGNHIDPMYAFKHRDLKDTELSRKGLPSRGVSANQAGTLQLLNAVGTHTCRTEAV